MRCREIVLVIGVVGVALVSAIVMATLQFETSRGGPPPGRAPGPECGAARATSAGMRGAA
ncbi:hypothetical protein [Leucobacter japonicus]|uniref:hypothetical protein n=1 Tax=Leucobacter japonicus TaxID=1461259 RepID=UPI0006A79E16|nr:hypothetical protein [Leucobacter japonicus]